MTPSPDFAPVRFSTEDIEERFRIEAWREVYGRKVLKVQVEPHDHEPFRSSLTLRGLPGLGVASGVSSSTCYRRTRGFTDSDDFFFLVQIDGGGLVSQRDRETRLESGDGTLLWGAETGFTDFRTSFRHLCLSMPYKALVPLIADLDAALARRITGDTEALRLMVSYIGFCLMQSDHSLATPELRATVVAQIYDLAALAIGATGEAAEISQARGVRAARLQAIKSDIMQHAFRQSFSIEQVALRAGVTPRYVRRLFEDTDETFTQFVLAWRLKLAYRLLANPRHDARSISSIAFDVGFSDLSHFNRTFRRRYGATPSEVRNNSARPE
jgi:AraC-like DNA-binding protein